MTLSAVVSAHAFKWKRAGKVKAIGVHVTDPRMAKNLSSLSPSKIVIITTKQTTTVLEIFLNLWRFLDFSHPSNKIFSKMIFQPLMVAIKRKDFKQVDSTHHI